MKQIILGIMFSSFSIVSFSQDYFVGFFGEGPDWLNTKPTVGHAFIGIGKGTPMTCDINGGETEMFGFYPHNRIAGGVSIAFGPVDAKIANDVRTKTDLYYFKKISFEDYIKVQIKTEEWKKKQYQLTKQDCISFFIDVAKLFPDLIIPDRTKYIIPENFVGYFIFLNKQ